MPISNELDRLSCELMGEALDQLAQGTELSVVASVMDEAGERLTCAFEEDSPEQCLEAARTWVREGARPSEGAARAIGRPTYYAIAYEGAVAAGDGDEAFADALILEFGERGAETGYSAYSLVDGVGRGERFRYTDPEAAGELPCLL